MYLQEWIDYHLKLGFDDIHIFQNDWRFNNPKKNKRVYFHQYDGKSFDNYVSDPSPLWVKNIQARCYTEFSKNYYNDYEWAAFFDVDEFLVLKQTNDVKEFIKNYDSERCLIINWAMFGDNGITDFDETNTSVIQRFTKRQDSMSGQFKCISKLTPNLKHVIHWSDDLWTDPDFNRGGGPYNKSGNFNKSQLNHYFTKTFPEFLKKIERGNACHGKRPVSNFTENNFNNIEDTFAKDFINNN